MKRKIICIVIFLASANAFAQLNVWRAQNPLFTEITNLRGVQMLSLQNIYACGSNGDFLASTDGGITWKISKQVLGFTLNFHALSFFDQLNGMICGDSGKIFRTTDGGASWSDVSPGTPLKFESIVMTSSKSAMAITREFVWMTTNGGTSWKSTQPSEAGAPLTSIRALSPYYVTVTALDGILYKSIDQGTSWSKFQVAFDSLTTDLYGQIFTGAADGTLICPNGIILHTTNGGGSWKRQRVIDSTWPLTASLLSVDGKDPNILCAVGAYGTIVYTNDGGASWFRSTQGIADTIYSISFFDKFNATAVGSNGVIIATSDGGASWRFPGGRPTTDDLYGVAFPKGDTSLGIACGYYGTILRTSDGGTHWIRYDGKTLETLLGVTFSDALTAFCVGTSGTILKSTNGGQIWTSQSSGTTNTLRAVSFPTPTIGWACGDATVLSTTDGGTTWIPHQVGIRKRTFTGVSFADANNGYLGCDHGVYSTTDGGVTWQEPDDFSYYTHVSGVYAPSANIVCMVSENIHRGTTGVQLCPVHIATSFDGAQNWKDTIMDFGGLYNGHYVSSGKFTGVFFPDILHGTAVGGNVGTSIDQGGHIFHTTDGGNSWHEQSSNTGYNLNAVSFGTRKAGTAVGNVGIIMRITTDE